MARAVMPPVQRGRTSLPQQIQRQRKPQGGIAEQGDDLSEDDKDKSVHGNLLLFYLQTAGLYLHTKKRRSVPPGKFSL